MGTDCPNCGEPFQRLAQHWVMIHRLFDSTPVSPSFRYGRVMLTADGTEVFFESIGEPVPG